MKQYNVGRLNELPIVYVFKCKYINAVEKCIKNNLIDYKFKKHKNNEIFKIDDDFIKETVIYCNKKSIILKENKKLLKSKINNNWLIIIDKNKYNEEQLYKPIKKYEKKLSKKTSKKLTKKLTKKLSKKSSKNINK